MLNYKRITSIFLYLVAIHSFCVGLLLVILPAEIISIFGFNEVHKNFFQVQGGVFHLIVCFAYIAGALNPIQNRLLINFAIFAKITAFLFLFSYYLFVPSILSVLLSGIVDLLMGIILLFLISKVTSFTKV